VTPAFLDAVLASLLPQEAEVPTGAPPLPGGKAAGLDLARYGQSTRPALAAIADQAGGEAAFIAAAPALREAAIGAVAQAAPEEFVLLINAILADYCESPAVLAAFGWRAAPPQPAGHVPPDMDDEARAALEKVRRRGKIWRG
jgi:hypothetical protein